MNTQAAIEAIETTVVAQTLELPQEVFLFVSHLTPVFNVDLLMYWCFFPS